MMHRLDPRRWLRELPTHRMLLCAILLAALGLRLFGLNWDAGNMLHPDELHVVNTAYLFVKLPWPLDVSNLLDPDHSTLNPRAIDPDTAEPNTYAYGSLPLYVTDSTAWLASRLTGQDLQAYDGGLYKVGRFLSALFDTGTVLMIYLIGSRSFTRLVGIFSALIYALTPMAIQLAHFFTTDAWLTFFVTVCLFFCIRAAEKGDVGSFALAGAAFGLAMATKASVLALALVIAITILWDARERWLAGNPPIIVLLEFAARSSLSALAALVAFGIFEPYVFARSQTYIDEIVLQSEIARGIFDVPFTRQYVGTTPLLYQAEQLARWGMGPVAGLLCLAGVLLLLGRCVRQQTPALLVIGVWLFTQGAVVVLPETKFMRYVAPLLPALVLAGGMLLDQIATVLRRRGPRLAAVALTAILIGISLSTAAFSTVYAAPNSRVEASVWMYENIAPGSTVGAEAWDIALPIALTSGLTPEDFGFNQSQFDFYEDRPPAEVADALYNHLSELDYVVMASNRVSSAMPQSPWRYPVQAAYYHLLESGALGFTLVAEFQNPPHLGGLTFDDRNADESTINYDHPRVLIYKKTALVSRESFNLLLAAPLSHDWSDTRHAPTKSLEIEKANGDLPVVDTGRWSARLTQHSPIALLVWIALLALLQFTGRPILAAIMPRAVDRGAGFARLGALLLGGYLLWITASLKLLSFSSIWTWLTFGLVLAASLWLRLRQKLASPRADRVLLGGEIAFWGVFALFIFFRWMNPDSWHPTWGGEKPMEFAHLNAILRSAHFPPYDPWFSGGYINYYYYGTYLVAYCIKLTGIPSEIAFNLAQPTVIALIASGAYSIGATLVSRLNHRRYALYGGVAAAVAVVLMGNLDAAIRTVNWLGGGDPPDFYGWTWAASRAISGAITEFPYFTGLYADMHAHVIAWPITLLIIALAMELATDARTLLITVGGGSTARQGALLTAARIALVGLAIGSLATTNAWDVAIYAALVAVSIWLATRLIGWLVLRLAIVGGMLASIGVLAIVLFLPFFQHYVALFGSLERTRSQTSAVEWSIHLGGWAVVIAIGVLALLARRSSERWPLPLQDPIVPLTVLTALGLIVLLPSTRNVTAGHLGVIALATVLIICLALAAIPSISLLGTTRRAAAIATIAIGGGAAIGLGLAERPALAFSVVLAIFGGALWFIGSTSSERYLGAMIAAGAAVAGGVEIVYLVDDLSSLDDWYRMNTVFKFYNQVWMLLALSAAVLAVSALARVLDARESTPDADDEVALVASTDELVAIDDVYDSGLTSPLAGDGPDVIPAVPVKPATSLPARQWARAAVVVSAVVLIAGLIYPLTATQVRLAERFPGHPSLNTLNALDWMRYGTLENDRGDIISFAGDLAAIDWMNDNIDGSPVIAEASIGPYRGNGSRFSIATGLPTILGWERHEEQQRYLSQLRGRSDDVQTLYDSADPAVKEEILRRYQVQYVIVGDVERFSSNYASTEGIAAFDGMVGGVLEVAFRSGGTTVYRVLPPSDGA